MIEPSDIERLFRAERGEAPGDDRLVALLRDDEEAARLFAWIRTVRQTVEAGAAVERHAGGEHCPDEQTIAELAFGSADAELAAHLGDCGHCVDLAGSVLAEAAADEDAGVPPGLLAEASAMAPPRPVPSIRRGTDWTMPGLLAAAAVALVAGLYFFGRSDEPAIDYAELARIASLEVRVLRSTPAEGFETHRREGLEAYATRAYAEALAHFDAAIEADPDHGDVWLYHGSAHLLQDRPEAARASFARCEALGGDLAQEARWQDAQALLLLGEADRARALLSELASSGSHRAGDAEALLTQLP